jgi:UDP-N-acetylglucosamine 2-epimerase (hydrolysing)
MKRILFISGTRADFGKLKPLINAVKNCSEFEYQIFGTGMHMLSKYGSTIKEIRKSGFDKLFVYMNQVDGESMEVILANTIMGLSRYLHENQVDLIVVHGDRVEALAGATVGALRNILVAHVEGGEISGTIDELMRHAISKLSHLHFVSNITAEKRLKQLGEDEDTIYTIGSPDIDVMMSNELPSIELVKQHYQVSFKDYALAILHPVTTDLTENQKSHANIFVDALLASNDNFIMIYPNNDSGSEHIFKAYEKLENNPRFRIYPSLRFEYFLTLLKKSKYLIGNSSAGIHEAPIYGVPTINIGSRQKNRFKNSSIVDVDFDANLILNNIVNLESSVRHRSTSHYGDGKSAEKFLNALKGNIWSIPNQKQFKDIV